MLQGIRDYAPEQPLVTRSTNNTPLYGFKALQLFAKHSYPRNMPCPPSPPSAIIQVSITMERQLKERYAKLAVSLDLSFSQLVRVALRRVDESSDYYHALSKISEEVPPEQ